MPQKSAAFTMALCDRNGAEPNSVLLFSETPLHIAASMVRTNIHHYFFCYP